MEKSRKTFASVLLLAVSVGICLAQHWSFGLQPGGKRSTEDLLGSFQEIAKEMEKLGEVQQSECPGSSQHSRLRDLKEAMEYDVYLQEYDVCLQENLMEGEGRRKI